MTALQEAERLLPKRTRAEKALLAQRLVSDLGDAFPGIERRPGACGDLVDAHHHFSKVDAHAQCF